MGEVWIGVHVGQGLPVAVKVITQERAREAVYRKAFHNEVALMAGLDHPAIVRVHDYGEVDAAASAASGGRLVEGSPYLAMDLATGSMRDAPPPTSWAEVREILLTLLAGLAHAHARGVVHRDLKPGNVLRFERVGAPGGVRRLRLSDFGLAHATDEEARARVGVSGTPRYMAPEQFAGRWRDFGPWTDLYALGSIGWWLATGQTPFQERGFARLKRVHLSVTPPVFQPRYEVPVGFEAWLRRNLEKDPRDRFQLAADAMWALLALPEAVGPGVATVALVARPEPTAAGPDEVEDSTQVGASPDEWGEEELAPTEEVVLAAPAQRFLPPMPESWRAESGPQSVARINGAGLGLYGLRRVPVIGRFAERDHLWAILRDVRETGFARAVVLRGEAGIGKSRLAEWLGHRAMEVGAALMVRVTNHDGDGGEGLSRALARAFGVQGFPPEMTLRTLERVFRAAKVEDPHEWNGLAELLAPMPGRGDVRFSRRDERYAVIHRALLVLGRTTDSAIIRPILLWVDDAQVSPEALGFLNWLLRAGAPGPILALLTVQDEALRARRLENALLTPLLARPDVSTVDVPPLGPADARALAEALLGLTSGLVEQVVDRTAGNPLFAVQLVGDWVQRGVLVPSPRGFTLARGEHATVPDDIHALWRTRIDQAVVDHPFDREALEIAAALGLEVRADEWAAVGVAAGVAPGPDLVERLRDAGLVSIEVDGWSFVHGMLRESLARSAREAGRWAAWHRLCARVLTERGAGSVGVAERLGRHLLEAGDTQAAIGPLLAGAAERRASSAYEEALALLDARDAAASETLTAADRVEGLVLRADVLVAMGRLEDAEAVALRAAADAEALVPPRPSLTGRAWRHAATAAGRRGRLADQADRARRGEAATAESDTLEWARCVLVRGSAARSFGAVEDAVSLHREALSRFAEAGDVRGQADALAGLGAASFALGQLAPAEAHVRKALALFERVGGRFGAASCQNALGEILRARGDLEAAELSYRRAETWMRALGSGEWLVPRVNRAQIWMAANKTTMAEQGLAEALTEVKKAGRKPLEAVVEALLVAVAAQAGDWAAFDKHLGRAMALLAETRVAEADAARALVGAGDAAMAAGQRGRAVRAWALGRDQWGLMGRVEDREAAAARLVPRTK